MGNRPGLPAGVGLFRPRRAGEQHQNQRGQPEQDQENRPSLRQAIGQPDACRRQDQHLPDRSNERRDRQTVGLPPVLGDQEERQGAVKCRGLRNQGKQEEQSPLRRSPAQRCQEQEPAPGPQHRCGILRVSGQGRPPVRSASTASVPVRSPSDQRPRESGPICPKGEERRPYGRLRREQKAQRRNHRRGDEQRGPLAVRDGLEEAGGQRCCRQPSSIPDAREAEGIAGQIERTGTSRPWAGRGQTGRG